MSVKWECVRERAIINNLYIYESKPINNDMNNKLIASLFIKQIQKHTNVVQASRTFTSAATRVTTSRENITEVSASTAWENNNYEKHMHIKSNTFSDKRFFTAIAGNDNSGFNVDKYEEKLKQLQEKGTPPETIAHFLLSKDVRNITRLGLWQTPNIIGNSYYIQTVENLLNKYWDTNDINHILLAQRLAYVITNENVNNDRHGAIITSSQEFDPIIYDRIIDFYFTTGNVHESRNLFQKLIEKDNGINLNLDRVFQYQNGINNLNNLFKDLKATEQEEGSVNEPSKIMQITVVNDEKLINETVHSFMVGINICETKDEIQQLFLSTMELVKKIENHGALSSENAIACFYMTKHAINLLGEDIDMIEIYDLYLYFLSSFYYHHNSSLLSVAADGGGENPPHDGTSNSLNINQMVNDVNNKPNKKVMQDIFKKLEVCVKKSLDEMEKSSNKKEFLARRNALLDANKKKSRKSLLSRLLDITKGDLDRSNNMSNITIKADIPAKNNVLNEDIFIVLSQNAPYFVSATLQELEARGLQPNKTTVQHMLNLLHTMYLHEKQHIAMNKTGSIINTDISALRKEFHKDYDNFVDDNRKEFVSSFLEKIERYSLSEEFNKEEYTFNSGKLVSQKVQELLHEFCKQIPGVACKSRGFNLENAEKTVKYCHSRKEELLEFLWNEHAETLIQSIWNKNMAKNADIVEKFFPQYKILEEEVVEKEEVENDDILEIEEVSAEVIEEEIIMTASSISKNNDKYAMYKTLANEIYTKLKFMTPHDRHVELSKMCYIRARLIENEARQNDLDAKKADIAAKKAALINKKAGKTMELKKPRMTYFKNCSLQTKRSKYYDLIVDDLLSIKTLDDRSKAEKLQNIENINDYIRSRIRFKMKWTKIDNYAIEYHYLFRTVQRLEHAIVGFKERDSTWNPLEIRIIPHKRLNYAVAMNELSSLENSMSIDEFYFKNLNLLVNAIDELGITEDDGSLVTAKGNIEEKEAIKETISKLQNLIHPQTDHGKLVAEKRKEVEKYQTYFLSKSDDDQNEINYDTNIDFEAFLDLHNAKSKKGYLSNEAPTDWKCKACGTNNKWYRVYCITKKCGLSRKGLKRRSINRNHVETSSNKHNTKSKNKNIKI